MEQDADSVPRGGRQHAFEKTHLHRLLGEHSLQLVDLLAVGRRGGLKTVGLLLAEKGICGRTVFKAKERFQG
jgi:hypothetical protein